MDRLGVIALVTSGLVVFLTVISVMDVSAEQQWTSRLVNMIDIDDANSYPPVVEGHEHSHSMGRD